MTLSPHARAGGAALVTVLFVLIAVLVVAVSAATAALNAEKSARNERDRHIALQAAEAALADAERDIQPLDPATPRAAMFAAGSALGFVDGCGKREDDPDLGLCSRVEAPGVPAWISAALAAEDASGAVAYGAFTGAVMPTGAGTLPARAPRYIIELMPFPRAGEDASQPVTNFYRITAIGFGSRRTTKVVLQSFYRKSVPPEGAAP
ncbi:pilus assembly protein [Massilia sp. RP-1-19]|uniref:Pilus assembly protein n=1 Tax=Massilia polaris TaxID=2728846 RepID=A0A848HK44_9BURK|nr:PilX N-terminal domain-containing pilus assembly protein [Massilia polaris]NML62216.1 pilus assembly protein [Massilia polaris]